MVSVYLQAAMADAEQRPALKPKFVVNQWYEGTESFRLELHRSASPFELFFDLVVVGVVHQLADVASETVSIYSIVRFLILFFPVWSMCSDFRSFINASGVNDVAQRLYSLMIMALIIGYTINGLAVPLPDSLEEWYRFDPAIRASSAFFLLHKGVKSGILLLYGMKLKKFRFHYSAQFAMSLVPIGLIACVTGIGSPFISVVLIPLSTMWENLCQYLYDIFTRMSLSPRYGRFITNKIKIGAVVAYNAEHFIERDAAFVEIVLGETVVNILFNAAKFPHAEGVSVFYGRAILVLMIASQLNSVYFTGEYSIYRTHALRDQWFIYILYTNLHWPLCYGLILASSAVSRMVTADYVENGLRYYWGGGVCLALACINILEILHIRYSSEKGLFTIGYGLRLIFRVGALVAFSVPPFFLALSDSTLLGIGTASMVGVIIESTVGITSITLVDSHFRRKPVAERGF